jgi:hypothetical protein
MNERRWRTAACIGIFVLASALIGREVLAHLATGIAADVGDPLLSTAILHWIDTRLPYTDAWYQLPAFYPSRDILTFSEHFLGIAPLSAPLEWITGNAVVTYNLLTVASFALNAAAMFALVLRLTGSTAAAFIAGLAYGFAPYRISQQSHLQMQAVWYAPLALLGLHAYLETGRRRWLAVYGVAWLLQGAANGYMLVFFSVLVGLWLVWFGVAGRRWRAVAAVGGTTVLAALPLAPILLRYIEAHRYYGLVRFPAEVRAFSADMAGVLCAPPALTVWGWIRVACGPEGELFPGVALFGLTVAAAFYVLGWRSGAPVTASRPVRLVRNLLVAAGVAYAAIGISVAWHGPWLLRLGPIHASATKAPRFCLLSVVLLLVAVAMTPGARAGVRRAWTPAFYVFAAALMWLLSLGPSIGLMGEPVGFDGPYEWLMLLPGSDGLRVPARFWAVAVLCLSVAAGLVVAELLKRRAARFASIGVPLLAVAVLADGWATIPSQPLPPDVPNRAALAGRTVLELPLGIAEDIAAQYHAILGGWRSVNGYSGYFPSYYTILTEASRENVDVLFAPLQALGDLEVVVPNDDRDHQMLTRRQPGVVVTGADAHLTQFHLPGRQPIDRRGTRQLAIASVTSRCDPLTLPALTDTNPATRWMCGPLAGDAQLVIDLGHVETAGAVMHSEGGYLSDYPRKMIVDTSIDGQSWQPAWSGNVWGTAIAAAMQDPKSLQIWFPFAPRPARYVRLTHPEQERTYYWSIASLEVWTR